MASCVNLRARAQCEPLCEHQVRTWLATLSPKSGTSQPETPTLLELCKLHAEALAGSTTTAAQLAERAAAKGKSWVDAPLPPGRHRAGDSSDDESDDGEDDMDMEGGGGGGGQGSGRQYQAPIIDEDGFQTVQTRSRSQGKRAS